MKFKIINGRIFDPTQKLNNKKQDLFVKDGQIVKPSPSEVYEYKNTYKEVEDMKEHIEDKLIGCVSEERFSRVKNDERYPLNAINCNVFLIDYYNFH